MKAIFNIQTSLLLGVFAIAGLSLGSACRATKRNIQYCELKQFFKNPEQSQRCLHVFRAQFPYCYREKSGFGESILEPSIAFEPSECVGSAAGEYLGYHHFILYEEENPVDSLRPFYCLLSCLEQFDRDNPPHPMLEEHFLDSIPATGGAIFYIGQAKSGDPDILHMNRRITFTKKTKLGSIFSRAANNGKQDEEEVNIDFHIESMQDPASKKHRKITRISKVVQRGSNAVSGTKPLVFDLSVTLKTDLAFNHRPFYTCINGVRKCNGSPAPDGENPDSPATHDHRHDHDH